MKHQKSHGKTYPPIDCKNQKMCIQENIHPNFKEKIIIKSEDPKTLKMVKKDFKKSLRDNLTSKVRDIVELRSYILESLMSNTPNWGSVRRFNNIHFDQLLAAN